MAKKDAQGNMHSEQDGKFVSNDDLSAAELKEQLQQELPDKEPKVAQKKSKTQEEFYGEEFTGVKGSAAIEKLLQEKRGHVKNAFERPEIGGIDLVWGDEHGGLEHTIIKRDLLLNRGTGHISGLDMVHKIPEIIEKGEFNVDDRDRPGFNYDGCRVAVRPSYDGQKLNWIVSAMELL